MIELIPSKYVRDYYAKKGITFSDAEKAAILWNRYKLARTDVLSELKKLAEKTADEELKEQISERLEYEADMERCFADNEDGQYIYTVVVGNRVWPEGYYADLDTALVAAKSIVEKGNFTIEKNYLTGKEMPVITKGRTFGNAVGTADYRADGTITHLWCMMPPEKQKFCDARNNNWFEDKLVFPENPFKRGDLVRICGTSVVGVVEAVPDSKEKFEERMEKGNLSFDFCAPCDLMVEFLSEDGQFRHDYPCIFELEKHVCREKNDVLNLASKLLKGETSLEYFLVFYDSNKEEIAQNGIRFPLLKQRYGTLGFSRIRRCKMPLLGLCKDAKLVERGRKRKCKQKQ